MYVGCRRARLRRLGVVFLKKQIADSCVLIIIIYNACSLYGPDFELINTFNYYWHYHGLLSVIYGLKLGSVNLFTCKSYNTHCIVNFDHKDMAE